MAVPPRPVSPEQMAEGRRLYEQTRMAVADIAALMGIAERTFFTRVRKWGWRRRMSRIPHDDPVRTPDEAVPAVPAPAPMAAKTMAIATRIERLVERELTSIEKVIARHGLDEEHTEQVERSARVLASLSRTLQEMKRLEEKDARHKDDNDRGPADPDEFVRDLVRRMDEVVARRTDAVRDEPAGGVS